MFFSIRKNNAYGSEISLDGNRILLKLFGMQLLCHFKEATIPVDEKRSDESKDDRNYVSRENAYVGDDGTGDTNSITPGKGREDGDVLDGHGGCVGSSSEKIEDDCSTDDENGVLRLRGGGGKGSGRRRKDNTKQQIESLSQEKTEKNSSVSYVDDVDDDISFVSPKGLPCRDCHKTVLQSSTSEKEMENVVGGDVDEGGKKSSEFLTKSENVQRKRPSDCSRRHNLKPKIANKIACCFYCKIMGEVIDVHPYVPCDYLGNSIFFCHKCKHNWRLFRDAAHRAGALLLKGEINEEICALCSDAPETALNCCCKCPRSFCGMCLKKVTIIIHLHKVSGLNSLIERWNFICSGTKATGH